MIAILKTAARRVLNALGLYPLYSLATRGPLKDDGWLRSVREEQPVDAAGRPIPWLTYPALEFLGPRVRPEWSVFEYGCGNSTLWWAARVREVVSCEHDRAWYEKVKARAPANVTLDHVPLEYGGAYCRAAAAHPGRFEVVVIDGRDRVNCARHVPAALKPDGVIVFDNGDRPQYAEGFSHLAGLGFHRVSFVGLAAAFNQKAETSILYRPGNCLGL